MIRPHYLLTLVVLLMLCGATATHAQEKLNLNGMYQLNKKSWSYSCTASDKAAGPYDVVIQNKKGKAIATGTIKHIGSDKLVLALDNLKSGKTGSYQFAYHANAKPKTYFDAQTGLKAEVDDITDVLSLIIQAACDTYLEELK